MSAPFQSRIAFGIPLVSARRVLAIDAGVHSIKIVLAEGQKHGGIHILEKRIIDKATEGLVSWEEALPQIRSVMQDLGSYPAAIALPQQISLSQLVDLSPAGTQTVAQLIEQETLKNREMGDSPIVYDCVRLKAFGRHQNSYWVTLCKEKDIFTHLKRLELPSEDICDVAPSAQSLVKASNEQGVLVSVDIGTNSTDVTISIDGEAIHNGTFAVGGALFTETIAEHLKCSVETAEQMKRTRNLLNGPDAVHPIIALVENWAGELERVVQDWLKENVELNLRAEQLQVVLCGGGALLPGFLNHLAKCSTLKYQPWTCPDAELSCQFAIAYGTAALALHPGSNSSSLLPSTLRDNRKRLLFNQRVLSACSVLLVIAGLLLAIGTWQKFYLLRGKKALLATAQKALEKARATETLEYDLAMQYERLRPVLAKKQQTLDTLRTLNLLEQTRSNHSLWYVLLSDQQSYFSAQPVAGTNPTPVITTNGDLVVQAPAFIAELCLNEEGELRRKTLGQVVAQLKQSGVFENVDTLPADRRRNLTDPKFILPEKHFTLVMESAGKKFQGRLTNIVDGTNQLLSITVPANRLRVTNNTPPKTTF